MDQGRDRLINEIVPDDYEQSSCNGVLTLEGRKFAFRANKEVLDRIVARVSNAVARTWELDCELLGKGAGRQLGGVLVAKPSMRVQRRSLHLNEQRVRPSQHGDLWILASSSRWRWFPLESCS